MKKSAPKNEVSPADESTLNLLPVAVILFDNEQVFFVNKKATQILEIPKEKLKSLHKFSIFQFLDKKYHADIRKKNKDILDGETLSFEELGFRNFKDKSIYIEAHSNAVCFKGKKVIQTIFTDISEKRLKASRSETAKDLLQKISANS